jgi:ABC-2 type transport system permease protein
VADVIGSPGAVTSWWHPLRRYVRLYWAVARYCLSRELEYRTNLAFNLLRETVYALLQIAFVDIIFLNVESIGDWTANRMLVLMGTYTFVSNTTYALFWETLTSLSSLINTGELDLVLTKPVSAQFYVSVRRIAFMNLAPAAFGIGIAAWGIGRLGITPSFLDVAAYAVLCACAVVTCYALWFSSVLGAFWAGRLQNAGAIFEPVVSMARVPTTSLASPLRLAFTFVLPLAFVGTVPAQAILGIAEPWHVPYAIGLAGALVIASNRLWHRALRAYSSASS